MKNEAATKSYSSVQEKMVANFLSWDVVSGSGARFKPGDVTSTRWLGECKTHVAKKGQIIFNKSVWQKIYNEAVSQLKSPVLFVDDGSLTIHNTWCMMSANLIPEPDQILSRKVTTWPLPFAVKTNIYLPADTCWACYERDLRLAQTDILCWRLGDVVILPLYNFKILLEEYLGC